MKIPHCSCGASLMLVEGINGMADPSVWMWATVTVAGCAALVAATVARVGLARELRDLRGRVEILERRRSL